MSSDDDFARFLATRDPHAVEHERFNMPSWSERTGSTADRLMRAKHRAEADLFWAVMRNRITPSQYRELMAESRSYEPVPKYKPRRNIPSASKQLQIAVEAAEKRIA